MSLRLSAILLTDNPVSNVQAISPCNIALKARLMNGLCWLILVCYTVMLLKPALPVLTDVVAHTFWEQQHLMTVHEEHGRFHIHYGQQKESDGKGRPANFYKYEAADQLHADKLVVAIACLIGVRRSHSAHYSGYMPQVYREDAYIPPKV